MLNLCAVNPQAILSAGINSRDYFLLANNFCALRWRVLVYLGMSDLNRRRDKYLSWLIIGARLESYF